MHAIPAMPQLPHPPTEREIAAALRQLTPQQRRRLNFIRIERLSPAEAQDLPGDFDPGLEFETWP